MLPFCGAPFLVGVGRRLADVGVRRLLLVVGADPSPFLPLVSSLAPFGVQVGMVPEPTPLDTAGGVREASLEVDGPFLVLNGDILTDLDIAALAAHHAREGADATIALTRVEDTASFGVCIRDAGRITGFVEKPAPGSLPGHDTVNAGTYLLEPGLLATFPAGPLSFERTVFPGLLAAGRIVAGFVHEGVWSDLGTPERFLDGQHATLAGELHWPPLAGLAPAAGPGQDDVRVGARVTVSPSARLVGPVVLGDDVVVAGGATIGPATVVGPGVEVGADAVVIGSILGGGARIGEAARLDRSLVAEGARIGAGARLERLCVVGPGAVVEPGAALPAGSRVELGTDVSGGPGR